jgi:hypothetical protein
MPLPVYMDAHVPSAVTAGLRRRGIDVLTSQEDGTDRLPDDQLLVRAAKLGRVLFSQDDDMLRLVRSTANCSGNHSGENSFGIRFR